MTSYPRWRIVNIEATSLLNRTSTSTYKQPQSTSIIEIIRNNFTFMLHIELVNYFITVKPDTNYFTASYRASSSSIVLHIHFQHPVPALYCIYISSIISCIQFQHCINLHPVPAAYRVSRNSIALLCIHFQQRIEIQFPNHINLYSTWTTFLMWLTGQRRE